MKVLVVDDYEDMRELIRFLLMNELGLQVQLASSGSAAQKMLDQDPSFALIVSDLNMPGGTGAELYQYHQQHLMTCPYLLLSSDFQNQPPAIQGQHFHWLAKPLDVPAFLNKVRSLLPSLAPEPDRFLPVPFNLLRRMGTIQVPLFIRINDNKYVKAAAENFKFNETEMDRFEKRGLQYLHIEASRKEDFIAQYRKTILSMQAWSEAQLPDSDFIPMNIELLKNMAGTWGWSHETAELARDSIYRTLHLVQTRSDLWALTSRFHQIAEKGFSVHCTLALLIATGLMQDMGYADETSLAKLSFASVFHDMSLSEDQWPSHARKIRQLTSARSLTREDREILAHAAQAAELCSSWDFCPLDVDTLILNHHERPDGSGFPLHRQASDLDFMSSLFIVATDARDFWMESYGAPDWAAYLQSRANLFAHGHFKSVFKTLSSSLKAPSKAA